MRDKDDGGTFLERGYGEIFVYIRTDPIPPVSNSSILPRIQLPVHLLQETQIPHTSPSHCCVEDLPTMAVLSDLPPHHQVLIDAINASARADPTLVNLQKVFNGLSEADKAALIELASQNPEPPAPLNPEQQAEFTKALGQEIAAAKKHLHWDAEKCAKACKKAANDFLNLVNKLSVISARDRSKESQALLIDFQALEKVKSVFLNMTVNFVASHWL
jgi:hypothetical protein